MDNDAFLALNRFGLGRRPEEPLPRDPHAWLSMQLAGPDLTDPGDLPDCAGALAIVAQILDMEPELKAEEAKRDAMKAAGQTPPPKPPNPLGILQGKEVHALAYNALVTQNPFRERLVWFWANHFSVTTRDRVVNACAGAYVREAIRPYATGKFHDMVLAVMRHPAMLNYLNQENSAGPDSRAGINHHAGLNENLARECLELHTVTPASGYSQADVTNFARILTGWSYRVKEEPRGFFFRPNLHEPGEIEVMGRNWPEGEQGGIEILHFLATHPSTYTHLATKLVRHFVADDPPPADVRKIANVLQDTDGDLGAAAQAVLMFPAAWRHGSKLRTPQDYVIACLRAVGATPDNTPNMPGLMGGLGQGLFQAPFPIGWPDRAVDWSSPQSILQRVDFAYQVSARLGQSDPAEIAQATLGPLLRPATLGAMQGAGARRDALTLLLASPDFQRR